MRYEDTSGSVGNSATPEARDDADALPTGSNGPATGNVITGVGTLTGKAGEDVAHNGHVVAIRGAGGTDTSDNGQSLHVDGRYGALVIDEHGNYKYVADGHAPEDFRDLFQYTLADAKGGRSVADLVISRGAELKVADNAQRIVPGPDGVVTLPAGVDLNDVHVLGRDLVVTLPDGSQIVIVDGAVFVPQLVLGGVEVPSTNLASLLVESELNTTAGTPQSSGGNFDVPVPPLDPGVPLGDLIPPTELVFGNPIFEEIGQFIDKHPDAGTVAVQLDDDAKAGGNPGGVGDDPDSVNATGFLPGSGGDGALTWDLLTSGAPSGFSYVDGPNGSILVQQVQGANTVTVLTITINEDTGAYTVIQNAAILHPTGDNENNVAFVINYTVTDSDGDSALGTLNVNVDDDTPTVSVTAGSDAEVSLTTHDAATIGANSEAVSTSANFSGVFSGTTTSPGADGAGAGTTDGYALSTTGGASGLFSHGVAINLYSVGGVIVGSTATTSAGIDASNTVFSVSTDNTGVVTLTQFSQIDHTADPNPTGAPFTDDIMSLTDGSITLTRSVTVVDRDGDSVTGSASVGIGANLHFVDDGPSIGLAEHGEPNLIVDESDLTVNDTQSFAANFSANFGADGPAAGSSITYALGINAGATGLIDVATGSAIVLVQNGAVVEGHVGDAAGALAFTVSVNAAGDVTLDQLRALSHPDGTNPDDSVTLANDNLVTLTATAHDFDGDTASSTLNIGQNLNFEDDGPSISLSDSENSLTVDETVLGTDDTQAFAGAFTSSFGADGAGTVTYDLNVLSAGADSGLIDSATGQPIVLVKNAVTGVIEGHVGNAGGALSFTVTVDANGNVTLDQILALQHPDPNNADDSVTLSADNLISLTATVTDKDGDSESATLNIGQNLNFEDDGPSAINDSDTIASGGTTATGNVITGIGTDAGAASADNAGADQPGHITAIQGAGGTDTTFSGGVLSIGGTYGTVNIDADGNYTYNRTPGSPGGVDDVFTYTLTDADGDSTTATLTIHIGDATPHTDPNPPVGLDDDALAGGNPGGTGDDPNSVNATGTLSGSGGDGALTFAVDTTGAPAGFTYESGGAGIVLIKQGGVTVLTVTVGSNGSYSVVQNAPIDHAAGGDENNAGFTINYTVTDVDGDSAPGTLSISVDDDTPLAFNDTDVTSPATDTAVGNVITGVGTTEGAANADKPGADGFASISNLVGFNGSSDSDPTGGFSVNGQFGSLQMDANGNYTYTRAPNTPGGAVDVFTYTYLDGDGDPATATLTITIADNTPVAGNVNVGLDDDALAGGNAGGTGDDPDSVNATGNLPGSGGDAPLTFGVLLTGAPAGFSYVSGGAGIVLVQQGGVTVLTVTVNSTTGAYSVVQNAPINHAAGGDENNQAFTVNYTVTDSDGDSAPGTISISVDDDTPTVSANAGVQLDDDALAGGNAGGTGDDANATNTTGTLAHSYGADGAGSVAYLTTGAPAGFSYALQGNGDLWVLQGATHVLTLTVNSTTGAYSVSQVAPIDHPAGLDENNVSFTISYNVTDHDGDSATGSIVVNVDDDTPTVSANAAVQLDDDALAGGNAGGIGDDANATNTSGTLAHSYGADGAGSVAYLTTGAPVGFSYALQGNGDLWVMQGATHVLTLTVNSSTGAYSVSQVAPIDHPAGLDENNVSFTISYQVTDHDGDSATGSIVVNVDDDTPTVSANAAVQLDDDALAGGNAGGTGDDADATNTSGTLAHSYGADGAGSMAYLTTGAPAGFTYSLQGNGDLWVLQGATHVLTLTINSSTGAYSVSQVAPIDHPAGLDENNVSFTISYNVTDHDGDSVTGSIVVNVDDDTPTVSANAAVQLDDDALSGGNAGGVGDVNPDTANTSGTLAHSFGADGAGSMAYLTTGAPAGFTYALQGNGDLWVMQGATHVITLTVNSSTGAYTVTQVAPVSHPAGGDENDASFTISYQVTDHDGDSVTGSIVVNVDDDTPTATIVATGANVSVDESVGIQVDSNDTTNAGVIALFAGVTTVGSDTDLPQYATNANAIVASTGSSVGADAPGTTGFSLNVSSAGVDSGLNTTAGNDILLYKEGNLIVGRVSGGADNGKAAFAIAIDSTGHISTVEYLSIQHPDATNPDDSQSIANGAVLAVVTVTDADGDSATQSLAIGGHIQFQDSGPVLTAVDNINIQNSGTVDATGGFHYLLGADGASADNNVFSVTGSATVNGNAVTGYTLSETSENATTAIYSFAFDYSTGASTTAHETGTLTFDKTTGQYTVDLDNPIQGVSVVQTATGTLFQGYEVGTSNPDNSQPDVSVTQIASNLFVQFTGIAEPSSGTGANNLHTAHYNLASGSDADPTDFANGDLFSQAGSWVSTSNASNGVAGDTIQGGEVLDFNLYTTNPTGNLGLTPTANADTMFLKFDGIGSSEDMIIVLKLYDTVTHTYTTKALMVQNSDIQKGPGSGSGLFSSITLDNNDGLIVIEPNDYQQGNTNLVIVGAQLAGSDEGITGNAINFNNAQGVGGASSGVQALSTDVSDGPMKISSIGFITTTTTAQNADLTFNVTIKDGDGDTVTQTIHATVTSAADSATPISLGSGVTTVAPVVLDLNGDGAQFVGTDAGVHYNYGHGAVATAWASPQDGILVNDSNHDGNVSASEFVFGSGGVTDLQALAALDSNHDGQLSSADANFGNFAVWQDANSNGVVDAGELQSLTARGIASISLSSDGIAYSAAGGDVQVAGTGSYTRADGSTGSLADAAFLTESRSASNSVLMGALAAAGLAAESAAAATTHASLAATTALTSVVTQHTQSLAPVAVDAAGGNHASDLLSAANGNVSHSAAQSASSHAADAGEANGLSVAGSDAHEQAPNALLQGTQAPVHDTAANVPAVAASIVMPAAQQLAGADAGAGAQHNEVVAKVLADALHGGANGATIDSALASLPGHGGANAALEALASHAGAAVPNGDSGVFAGFTAANTHFTMEHMIAHVDAAPSHG